MAASFAVEKAAGYRSDGATFAGGSNGITQKAVLIRNLVLASEYLMSHITHFYALAALDYVMGPPMSPWVPYFGSGAGASAAGITSGWDKAALAINYPSGYQESFGYYHAYLKPGAIGGYDTLSAHGAANSAGYIAAATGVSNLSAVLYELNDQKTIWSKVIADYVVSLHMRRRILEVGAQFAGGLPMFRTLVMGGVAVDATSATIQNWITEYRKVLYSGPSDDTATYSTASPASGTVLHFIKNSYVPLVNIVAALYPKWDNTNNGGSGWGAGWGNFLGYGVFNSHNTNAYGLSGEKSMVSAATTGVLNPFLHYNVDVTKSDAKRFHNRGYVTGASDANAGALYSPTSGDIADFHKRIVEVADYSWYYYWTSTGSIDASASRHPWDGETDPTPSAGTTKYSWAKGPRIWHNYPNTPASSNDLLPMQVGPLARMWVTGLYRTGMTFDNSLTHWRLGVSAKDLGAPATIQAGISTMDRHRARALECYLIGIAAAQWLEALNNASVLNQDSYTARTLPSNASGFGLHEAPRGALGHWVLVDSSKRIQNWQAVVPSTWIDSPKDYFGSEGPLEKSIVSPTVTVTGEESIDFRGNSSYVPVEVIRIIHSYDPCLACTVHVVEKDGEKGVRK
jgi:Ni,Fe-hydrogenase I large subunit